MFSIKSLMNTVANNITASANKVSAALREEPTQTFPSAAKNVVVETVKTAATAAKTIHLHNINMHTAREMVEEEIKAGNIEKELTREYVKAAHSTVNIDEMAMGSECAQHAAAARTAAMDIIRHIRKTGMAILRKLRITNFCSWIKVRCTETKVAAVLAFTKVSRDEKIAIVKAATVQLEKKIAVTNSRLAEIAVANTWFVRTAVVG